MRTLSSPLPLYRNLFLYLSSLTLFTPFLFPTSSTSLFRLFLASLSFSLTQLLSHYLAINLSLSLELLSLSLSLATLLFLLPLALSRDGISLPSCVRIPPTSLLPHLGLVLSLLSFSATLLTSCCTFLSQPHAQRRALCARICCDQET